MGHCDPINTAPKNLIAGALTYMATILILEARGDLQRVEVELKPRDMPERSFYAYPRVTKWLDEKLPTLEPVLDQDRQSPIEQVDFLLYEFIRGGSIAHWKQAHIMTPKTNGVWELKTPDIRFFGWFACKDCFVAAEVASAAQVKDHNLYGGYQNLVVFRRSALDLDEPKFVVGGIESVLST